MDRMDMTTEIVLSILFHPVEMCCPTSSSAVGLEQLNRVAGRVLDQNLLAAIASDDLVPEMSAPLPECGDGGTEILNLDLDPVPTPGRRYVAVRHGLAGATSPGPVQQQRQIAPNQPGEPRRRMDVDAKAQHLGVEGNGRVDISDDVTDTYRAH